MDFNNSDELMPENFPKGALVLLDSFYWDCTNEFSPLGNDTGSDLFYAYLNWRSQHQKINPVRFLVSILQSWGVNDEGWELTASDEIQKCLNEDSFSFLTRDDAIIALAFSQIVLEGEVSVEVGKRALIAIRRQLSPEVTGFRLATASSYDRAEKLEKMRTVLMDLVKDENSFP